MRLQINVLIVEDEPDYGRILTRLIQNMGLNPLLATNIPEALDFLARNKVRLILLDRLLDKGADGLTLCLALKKDVQTRPIPVIVLTAMSDTDGELKGYKYGADLYLRKPFSVKKLMRYIGTFLGRLPYKDEIKGRIIYENIVLNSATRTLTIGGRSYHDLPIKQFDFLALLASHKGNAVSRAYLVKKLWEDRVRDKEVDVLVYRLKQRLGTDASCIAPVRSYGYRLRPLSVL